jgi:hypothetical protein
MLRHRTGSQAGRQLSSASVAALGAWLVTVGQSRTAEAKFGTTFGRKLSGDVLRA